MRGAVIIKGEAPDDGVSDCGDTLVFSPPPDTVAFRSVSIASSREGFLVGKAEVYFESVDVLAECEFNSHPLIALLLDRSGRPIIKAGGLKFLGRVTIAQARVSVGASGCLLPVISATVSIHGSDIVRASVVFPDQRGACGTECWTPEACAALLEACGWQLGEAP